MQDRWVQIIDLPLAIYLNRTISELQTTWDVIKMLPLRSHWSQQHYENVQIELRNLQSWNPKIQVFVIPNLSAKIYALTFDSCSSCLFVSRSARISSDCNWKHNHSPSVRVGENLWTNITLFFWSKGGGQSQIIFLFFSLTTPKDRTRVVSGYKLRAVTNPTTPLVATSITLTFFELINISLPEK